MIKEILRRTLILAAIMILAVFAVSAFSVGLRSEILLVLQLTLLAFILTCLQQLLRHSLGEHFLLSLSLEYLSVSLLVLLYGHYVGWFLKANWWMAFLYVALVYIPIYFLDLAIVKRDVKDINTQLEKRRKNHADREA